MYPVITNLWKSYCKSWTYTSQKVSEYISWKISGYYKAHHHWKAAVMSNNLVIFLLIQNPTKRASGGCWNDSFFWQQKEAVLSSEASAIRNDKYPVTEMKSIGEVVLWSYSGSSHHLASPKGWAMLMQHTVRSIILCIKLIRSSLRHWVHGKSASVNERLL